MSLKPLVSIIIPAYNKENYIAQTIESVLNQTYPYFELIIVNNGSTDKTNEQIRRFLPNSKITYLNQGKLGPAQARNAGAKIARGQCFLFLDADDFIEPTYLEKALEKFDNNPTAEVILTNARIFGVKNSFWQNKPFDLFKILKSNQILSTAGLIKKSAWQKIGNFDRHIPGLEDWDFWLRAKINDAKFEFVEESLFNYRQLNLSQNTQDNQKYYRIASYLRKKYPEQYSLRLFNLFKLYPQATKKELFIFWLENIFYRILPDGIKKVFVKLKNKSRKKCLLAFLLIFSLTLCGCVSKNKLPKQACFSNQCLDLELARTVQEKTIGLMNHEELNQSSGMLFAYDNPKKIGIWMKNMHFPIDIVWLDENLNVVYLIKNAPPCQPNQDCPTYANQAPAQYVLEMNAGLIEDFGLELGQTFEFKY